MTEIVTDFEKHYNQNRAIIRDIHTMTSHNYLPLNFRRSLQLAAEQPSGHPINIPAHHLHQLLLPAGDLQQPDDHLRCRRANICYRSQTLCSGLEETIERMHARFGDNDRKKCFIVFWTFKMTLFKKNCNLRVLSSF